MALSKNQLPDFAAPPLIEVALGVQFESLSTLHVPQLGLLWQHYRDRFPVLQEHHPIDAATELFGIKKPVSNDPRLQLLSAPVVPRCWFLNEDQTQVIQVQQDRFIHNWRKVQGEETYPRFESVRSTFVGELENFQSFLLKEGLGELEANQCEVIYVNHIFPNKVWETHDQLDKVLSILVPVQTNYPLEQENAQFATRYVLRDESSEFLGRLHIEVTPKFIGKDFSPIFELRLTARGRPLGSGIEGIVSFMNLGREYIVRTFTDFTSKELHSVWGRKDV